MLPVLLLLFLVAGCAVPVADLAGTSPSPVPAAADRSDVAPSLRTTWLHRIALSLSPGAAVVDPCRLASPVSWPGAAGSRSVAAEGALLVDWLGTLAGPTSPASASPLLRRMPGVDVQVQAVVADATRPRHDDQPPQPACRIALQVFDGLSAQPMWAVDATAEAQDRSRALLEAWEVALRRLAQRLPARPPEAAVLAVEADLIWLSGGADQGLAVGQSLAVHAQGDRVRSRASGGVVILPGRPLARVRIERVWPRSVAPGAALPAEPGSNGGALARVVEGRVAGWQPSGLTVPLALE